MAKIACSTEGVTVCSGDGCSSAVSTATGAAGRGSGRGLWFGGMFSDV
jgi:hypothetical protein